MRKMIYVFDGFETSDYEIVKQLNKPFTIRFEDVKEEETPEAKAKRLERIKLANEKRKARKAGKK